MDDAASLRQEVAELEQNRRHLAAAYATTRVLAESATLGEATPRILQTICETLAWDYGGLWSVDRQADVLYCVESWHTGDVDFAEFDAITHSLKYAHGVGLPGMVWADRKPVWLDAGTARGQLPDLELRHRRRARCEDRIRMAKDTGLTNLPLHGFDQNRIWCALVQLAIDLTAWLQMLAFDEHPARRLEPKRLRLRLFSIAGRIACHARRTRLRLAAHAPWAGLLATALARLQPG